MKRKRAPRGSFDSGVIYAAAIVVQLYDEPTIAKEILRASDADIKRGDEYDIEVLRSAGVIE